MGSNPPFRPPVYSYMVNGDFHLVMDQCWRELPEERPGFTEIRKLLRKLHGGK